MLQPSVLDRAVDDDVSEPSIQRLDHVLDESSGAPGSGSGSGSPRRREVRV